MQQGGEGQVTGMEGVDNENGSAIARPEADAAAATKEAAIQVVAAMSRRVRGGDKAAGIVAGYARPGADKLHTLRGARLGGQAVGRRVAPDYVPQAKQAGRG